VELAFKWGSRDWIRRTLWTYVENGPKAFDSAMALDGEVAHAVWAVKMAGTNPHFVIYYLGWNVRLNTCARDPNASIDTCREMVSKSNEHPKTHPDIAVDGNGVPHVVWAEETTTWDVYYDNRNGGLWSNPAGDVDYRISSLSPGGAHVFQQQHPVITADNERIYVAWDLDDEQPSCYDNRTGTHFRLRTATTGAATQALWDPPVTQEGVRLSRVGDPCGSAVYGWPTIDTRLGQTYVMWQYLRDQESLGLYSVYTYTLEYRVFDAGGGEWWPDAASQSYREPAEMPWDSTSLYADHAYYSGLRPAIELVSSGGVITPYVAWHAWTPPGSGGSRETEGTSLQDVEPAAASDEPYVTGNWPYQVFYAAGTFLLPGELSSLAWSEPVTVPVGARDRILCWPDLALASYDGGASYYLHLAVHLRPAGDVTAKSAWYTNLDRYYFVFLPVVRRS
jgi:hypothetical protein